MIRHFVRLLASLCTFQIEQGTVRVETKCPSPVLRATACPTCPRQTRNQNFNTIVETNYLNIDRTFRLSQGGEHLKPSKITETKTCVVSQRSLCGLLDLEDFVASRVRYVKHSAQQYNIIRITNGREGCKLLLGVSIKVNAFQPFGKKSSTNKIYTVCLEIDGHPDRNVKIRAPKVDQGFPIFTCQRSSLDFTLKSSV